MNHYIIHLCVLLACLSNAQVLAINAQDVPKEVANVKRISSSLESSDPKIRREAVRQLALDHPEKKTANEIIPILVKGLGDDDDQVRTLMSAVAYRVAYAQRLRAMRPDEISNVDLSKSAEIARLLLKLIDDKEADTRNHAISTLGIAFAPQADIERHLVDRYKRESSVRVRETIVGVIGLSKYSSKDAIETLIARLADEHPSVQARAAQAIGETKPELALPRLIDAFPARLPSVNQNILRAISKYGSSAKPFLPRLTEKLTQLRQGEEELQKTIELIRSTPEK
jgi:HEAT repeat protein